MVEVNPPLIVWISAIPIQIAGMLRIDAQSTAIPFFVAAVLGCAWWTASLLQSSGGLFEDRVPVFAAIGTVLLVVPAGDLGQREHLIVAAILPYLVLFARSLDGERPGLRASLIAGVLAGLGCALKPLCRCVHRARGAGAGPRPEPCPHAIARRRSGVAGLCRTGRADLPCLSAPRSAARTGPVGVSDAPFRHLLIDSLRLMFGQAVALLLWWNCRRRMPEANLMLTLVVFAITSTAICFMDGKDWFYHRLPATIATLLALLCWAASVLFHRRASSRTAILPAVLAGVGVVVFLVAAFQRLEPQVVLAVEPDQMTVVKLERLIRQQKARTYIAFSEWIALGFPVVNNTGVAWASRFDSMWALKGELWRVRFDASAAKEWPIRRWVAHDFIVGCPDIAVVDTREGWSTMWAC